MKGCPWLPQPAGCPVLVCRHLYLYLAEPLWIRCDVSESVVSDDGRGLQEPQTVLRRLLSKAAMRA
jgi:hypothetical protein